MIRIQAMIDKSAYEAIKAEARTKSDDEDRRVSISELVRRAIYRKWRIKNSNTSFENILFEELRLEDAAEEEEEEEWPPRWNRTDDGTDE